VDARVSADVRSSRGKKNSTNNEHAPAHTNAITYLPLTSADDLPQD